MKKITFFIIALTLIMALSACDSKKTGDAAALADSLAAAAEAETEEAQAVSVVGSWDYEGYVYTFNADNTGQYALPGGTVMKLTYEVKADTISILFDGNTTPNVCTYSIADGKFTISDSFGGNVVYTKK